MISNGNAVSDTDYYNASPAILNAYAEEMTFPYSADLVIFVFKNSDRGPFIELVAGDLVGDPETGEETIKDRIIRLSPTQAADLAAKLVDAAGEAVR